MSDKIFVEAKEFVCEDASFGLLQDLRGYHFNNVPYLCQSAQEELFDKLYPVALSAFCRNDSDSIRKDVFNHIIRSENLAIVLNADGDCVAFRLWDFVQLNIYEDILYLAGMCIHSNYQRCGIGSCLLDYVFKSEIYRQIHSIDQICALPKCKYIALRTQSPIMK